jgi:SAM-dependent methyltransferase
MVMTLKDGNLKSDLPQESYPPLILTGERTLPGFTEENYWFQRHLVAYKYLLPLVEGKSVLDLGCGEGYGVDLLATRAEEAVGVDLAPEALYHARRTYRRGNLRFLYMDINQLGLEDDSFDVVCSLQVIEHLHDTHPFMQEIMRVLKPEGICVLSTPNKALISPGRETPINPFHIREYDYPQFLQFMQGYFAEVDMVGIFHAGRLKLHDTITRRNFSQFCLGIPPRLNRWFYLPWFLPSLKTRHFNLAKTGLSQALDFIALGRSGPSTKEAEGG